MDDPKKMDDELRRTSANRIAEPAAVRDWWRVQKDMDKIVENFRSEPTPDKLYKFGRFVGRYVDRHRAPPEVRAHANKIQQECTAILNSRTRIENLNANAQPAVVPIWSRVQTDMDKFAENFQSERDPDKRKDKSKVFGKFVEQFVHSSAPPEVHAHANRIQQYFEAVLSQRPGSEHLKPEAEVSNSGQQHNPKYRAKVPSPLRYGVTLR